MTFPSSSYSYFNEYLDPDLENFDIDAFINSNAVIKRTANSAFAEPSYSNNNDLSNGASFGPNFEHMNINDYINRNAVLEQTAGSEIAGPSKYYDDDSPNIQTTNYGRLPYPEQPNYKSQNLDLSEGTMYQTMGPAQGITCYPFHNSNFESPGIFPPPDLINDYLSSASTNQYLETPFETPQNAIYPFPTVDGPTTAPQTSLMEGWALDDVAGPNTSSNALRLSNVDSKKKGKGKMKENKTTKRKRRRDDEDLKNDYYLSSAPTNHQNLETPKNAIYPLPMDMPTIPPYTLMAVPAPYNLAGPSNSSSNALRLSLNLGSIEEKGKEKMKKSKATGGKRSRHDNEDDEYNPGAPSKNKKQRTQTSKSETTPDIRRSARLSNQTIAGINAGASTIDNEDGSSSTGTGGASSSPAAKTRNKRKSSRDKPPKKKRDLSMKVNVDSSVICSPRDLPESLIWNVA